MSASITVHGGGVERWELKEATLQVDLFDEVQVLIDQTGHYGTARRRLVMSGIVGELATAGGPDFLTREDLSETPDVYDYYVFESSVTYTLDYTVSDAVTGALVARESLQMGVINHGYNGEDAQSRITAITTGYGRDDRPPPSKPGLIPGFGPALPGAAAAPILRAGDEVRPGFRLSAGSVRTALPHDYPPIAGRSGSSAARRRLT